VAGQATECLVRRACADDFLGVVRVLARDPTLTDDALSEGQRMAWQRMMATADLKVFVADLEGEIIGTTSLLVMPHLTYDCHPTAFIEPVVVAEPYRRQRVATAMLRLALAEARTANCRKVQLLSHKQHANDGAHDLYRSVGFEAEAEGFRLYLD
jgi:GNAT superfamily N-acetyltransferase